jgi:serine/threonine protein phosphatase PrpC
MDHFMIFQSNKNAHTFVQGNSHRGNKTPCQDRTFYIEEHGLYVMTLADGAGSKEFSHLGAEIVTQMTARILADSFNEYIQKLEEHGKTVLEIEQNKRFVKESILDRLTKQLEDYALANKIPSVKDLASTLLFCVVDYRNRYIIGHIGDGLIGASFLTQEDGYSMVLSEPENGEQSNITFFVTDDKALDHFRIQSGVFTNLEAIYLMSDGVADVFYSSYEGLSDEIRQFALKYQGIPTKDFEQTLRTVLETSVATQSDDDLSINVFYVERLEDKAMPKAYYQTLLESVNAKEKIFRLSPYAVALHQSLRTSKIDFSTATQVKEYIYE